MIYTRVMPVEFNHCDPMGIVFYPRYFEMTNSLVENFFADVMDHSFCRMIELRQAVPMARIEVNFKLPSRLGDRLDWSLQVVRVGGSSVNFVATAMVGGQMRLSADLTLVWVDAGTPTRWPDAMRARFEAFEEGTV